MSFGIKLIGIINTFAFNIVANDEGYNCELYVNVMDKSGFYIFKQIAIGISLLVCALLDFMTICGHWTVYVTLRL